MLKFGQAGASYAAHEHEMLRTGGSPGRDVVPGQLVTLPRARNQFWASESLSREGETDGRVRLFVASSPEAYSNPESFGPRVQYVNPMWFAGSSFSPPSTRMIGMGRPRGIFHVEENCQLIQIKF